MDAVSYSHSAKQAKRIKKIINEPDSTSGVVTVPKVIPAGETITIPVGRTAVLPNVQVDGTLTVDGDVFVPSGATYADLENQIGTKADTTYVNNKPSGFKNYIINGGFDVWQRGTSFSSLPSNTYFADRWLTYSPSGTMDLSILTNGTYATNGLIWNKTTSNAEYIIQNIENIRKFINKEVTVSFYIHNNGTQTANYLSGLSYIYNGSPNIYEPNNYSFTLAPQEVRLVSFTRTLDYASVFNGKTIGTNSYLQFFISQPAGQNNNGENIIHNVQLEEGSVATPFEQRPYGLELSLCQRFTRDIGNSSLYGVIGNGFAITSTVALVEVDTTGMRNTPILENTLTASNFELEAGINRITCTAISINGSATANTNKLNLNVQVASGLTNRDAVGFRNNNNSTNKIILSSEL